MKNKKVLILSVSLIILLLLSLSVYAVYESNRENSGDESNWELQENDSFISLDDAWGPYIEEEKINTIRKFDLWGEPLELTYLETFNNVPLPLEERSDAYGTNEVFIDGAGNKYEFLYNTDILCGYFKNFDTWIEVMMPEDSVYISEEEALEIASSFIKNVLKIDNDYRMRFIDDQSSRMNYYQINFINHINGYATDDYCNISVNATTGEVVIFFAMNRNRYDNYKNIIADEEKTFTNFTKSTGIKTVDHMDKYIKISDNGILTMCYCTDTEFTIPLVYTVKK